LFYPVISFSSEAGDKHKNSQKRNIFHKGVFRITPGKQPYHSVFFLVPFNICGYSSFIVPTNLLDPSAITKPYFTCYQASYTPLMIFKKQQLLKAIQSDIEIVAIWGAFQVLKLNKDQLIEYLPFFLKSPFIDIQDAGIAKIAEFEVSGFTPDIVRIFRESEGQLKYTAAYALSRFPNDIIKSLLQKWFEQLSTSNQSTRIEFEAATHAYLNVARENHFNNALKLLISSHSDIIRSSVLFTNLLIYCQTKSEYLKLIDQYFVIRDQYSDAELTLHLVDSFIYPELGDWWMVNLSKGYSISSIYEQCYILLGLDENLTDRNYWNEIEKAIGDSRIYKNSPDDPKLFVETILIWMTQLLGDDEEDNQLRRLKWIIEAFGNNESLIPNTIPKILELETRFLLSIPLYVILEKSFRCWMNDPINHVERIANYYHSTLLIDDYREKILSLFFPKLPDWTKEQMRIVSEDSPISVRDNKNGIIWSFYRGDLLGHNISWPTIFPNPDYSLHLAEGLAKIYSVNFPHFIKKNDKVSIDYSLQLFQLIPTRGSIDLIIRNFDYLYQHHTQTIYQTIEYIPDPAFMDHLVSRYEFGEQELARLILLISEIFNLEIPELIRQDIEKMEKSGFQISGVKKHVRLKCGNCHSTFQYPVEMIYIDEGAIIRLNQLSYNSIWVSQQFFCKKCQAKVEFTLDDTQLEELSQQSKVDRILKITPQPRGHYFGFQTCLIDFPRYNGKTYTPQEFFDFMKDIEDSDSITKDDLKILWMKLARLKKDMSMWEDCKDALEKVRSLEKIDEEWMFLQGFVNLKLSLFADARKYFDWILKKHPEGMPHDAFMPYVEKSRYYLNMLDSKASKKARFKIITGKK